MWMVVHEHAGDWFIFFFNDTATTEIYTLSLHDALPICEARTFGSKLTSAPPEARFRDTRSAMCVAPGSVQLEDRKSTRLNSSHANISYAVFCLKKKKITVNRQYELHTITGLNSSPTFTA